MSSWVADAAAFELGTDGPQAIVVGIDGSPTSLRALDYAAGLARRQNARLVAVHVRSHRALHCPIDPYGFSAYIGAEIALEAQEALLDDLRSEVERLGRTWRLPTELVFRDGDALRELTAVAQEQRAECIVVGSSTRLGSRLAGSLPARLVRRRGWPVTVVS